MSFILGKKSIMSQIWKNEKIVPITVVEAAPNKVTFIRTKERDGYEAVQVSLGKTKREFRNGKNATFTSESFKEGAEVTVEAFKEGDIVRVAGITKGKGFQGVVKRHGFHGGPKTHGQKNRLRAPGSIGNTTPQRVIPGRKMAGHMGDERITVINLEIAGVDKEKNILMIKGAVPGARGGVLEISRRKRGSPVSPLISRNEPSKIEVMPKAAKK